MNQKTRPFLAIAVALAFLLSACSGSSSSDGTDADEAAPTTQPAGLPEGPSPAELGDHAVGRRTVTMVDPSREDRELVVDLWYPADADEVEAAPKAVYQFIPGVEFTSEVAGADVAVDPEGGFPFVVYSHGSSGQRFVASTGAEVLASHGFVVAAPDHAGNTAIDAFTGTRSTSEQNAIDRPLDTSFLITEVLDASASDDDPLSGAVDPDRIGIYGHSFGGYTALAAVSGHGNVPADDRIIAAVGQAPYTELLTDDELEAVDVPTMLLSGTADVTTSIADNTERPWELISGRPLYRVDIADAGHQSFADVCDYQRLLAEKPETPEAIVEVIDDYAVEGCGPDLLDIDEAHEIIDTYTVAFLMRYVAGDDSAEAFLSPEYAETFDAVELSVEGA